MEELEPYSFGRPAHEAIVKRLAWAVEERRIRPAATGLQHMHNAADHPAIIDARLAASVGRQMRHKPRELTIVEPEMISIIEVPPSGTLNQKMRCLGIQFMGPSPSSDSMKAARHGIYFEITIVNDPQDREGLPHLNKMPDFLDSREQYVWAGGHNGDHRRAGG